ncbi:hypothetical protein [Microseira wollei]|uniref:Uncharacterized protein n=1 Tax=Microseira wollei NIES-4236 TaxID=2530354 RepID=A0AAV3XKD6_9CYAN|nr:hypothetical protein [Microseira wollei]GET43133.1 hypothetical protein MiSe_79540 [Microseira wollei NIES-4236]
MKRGFEHFFTAGMKLENSADLAAPYWERAKQILVGAATSSELFNTSDYPEEDYP